MRTVGVLLACEGPVRASSQASPGGGASALVVSRADAPPVGAWKCRRGGGQRRVYRRRAAVGAPSMTVSCS